MLKKRGQVAESQGARQKHVAARVHLRAGGPPIHSWVARQLVVVGHRLARGDPLQVVVAAHRLARGDPLQVVVAAHRLTRGDHLQVVEAALPFGVPGLLLFFARRRHHQLTLLRKVELILLSEQPVKS